MIQNKFYLIKSYYDNLNHYKYISVRLKHHKDGSVSYHGVGLYHDKQYSPERLFDNLSENEQNIYVNDFIDECHRNNAEILYSNFNEIADYNLWRQLYKPKVNDVLKRWDDKGNIFYSFVQDVYDGNIIYDAKALLCNFKDENLTDFIGREPILINRLHNIIFEKNNNIFGEK